MSNERNALALDPIDQALSRLPLMAARVGSDKKLQFVNSELAKRLNQSTERLLKEPLPQLVLPEVAEVVNSAIERALSGESTHSSLTYDHPDLGQRFVELIMQPHIDEDGLCSGALFFLNDLTDKEHLKLKHRELQEFIGALDVHAIVAVTDLQGAITYVNDKFCEISGYSRDELIGQTHRTVKSNLHPPSFYESIWQTISGGEVWQGEICNRAKDGSHYWVYTTIVPCIGHDGLPQKYIAIRADITELKRIQERAYQLAHFDPLTNLPNRRLLNDRLDKVREVSDRDGSFYGLLCIDLDDFGKVNDAFGHSKGDLLLLSVASRISALMSENDLVAHMGADEFLVVLGHLASDTESALSKLQETTRRINLALGEPYTFQQVMGHSGTEIICTASIGAAFSAGKSLKVEELLQRLDLALNKAKSIGHNRIVVYDEALGAAASRRLMLEHDLRHAVSRGQLVLYYQPIVDRDQSFSGVEALVRWQHPSQGMISPAEFIPIAEQSGLIVAIGEWVLDSALRQLRQWQEHPLRRNWTMSVNISARQFRDPEMVTRLLAKVASHSIPPSQLILELTETALLADEDGFLLRRLNELNNFGIKLALDDFGTGYSSLSYLTQLPLSKLKIDQSFVRAAEHDPNSRAISEAVIHLGNRLGLKITAEGVETVEQFNYLLGKV